MGNLKTIKMSSYKTCKKVFDVQIPIPCLGKPGQPGIPGCKGETGAPGKSIVGPMGQWVHVVCPENQEFQDALDLSVKQELKAQPEHQELKVIQESQDAQDQLDLVVKKEIVVPQVSQERLYTSTFMMIRNTMGNMMRRN